MKEKTFELDLYIDTFGSRRSKSIPLNMFIKNWNKMEKKNHIKDVRVLDVVPLK